MCSFTHAVAVALPNALPDAVPASTVLASRVMSACGGTRQSVRAAHTMMRRRGHTDYLAHAMLLPRHGGCFAILYDNAYYFMLTLVTMPLYGVEGFLHFHRACTTRQHNIFLFC